jgi:hypothetical protein
MEVTLCSLVEDELTWSGMYEQLKQEMIKEYRTETSRQLFM